MDLSQLSNDDLADLIGDAVRAAEGRLEALGQHDILALVQVAHSALEKARERAADPGRADGPVIQPMSGGGPK